MYIRAFAKTDDQSQAIQCGKEMIEAFLGNLWRDQPYEKVENYWKDNTLTVIEFSFSELKGKHHFVDALSNISNKWIWIGSDEVLTSDSIDECVIKYNMALINIFLIDSITIA